MQVVAELKKAHPELVHMGSGYSYLQQWLPNVAQAVVETGLGRHHRHRSHGAELSRHRGRRARRAAAAAQAALQRL